MLFQMPVETSRLGRITTGDIEAEIRRRGIYVEGAPYTVQVPEVLPRPETRVVIIPGDGDLVTITEPWLPRYPVLPEPELTELYSPPYAEEDILPLTRVYIPEEAKASSRIALILGIVVLALAAMT